MERRTAENGVLCYVSPLLEAVGVPHAFSTRMGGVSAGSFASMNLGNPNGCPVQDDLANIAENYRRLMTAIGCAGRRREWVHQVHGCNVFQLAPGMAFDTGNEKADALITRDPGRVLSVRVADCVPVLVASSDGATVAAVHAGWRGVVAGIVPAVVAMMTERGRQGEGEAESGRAAESLLAAIGPCIGYDAFEVGEEVIHQFCELQRGLGCDGMARGESASIFRRVGHGKGRVDLRGAILGQLLHAGLAADRIDVSDRCTYRDAEDFFRIGANAA